MSLHTAKLASLIASRICHDLISPVGAISNGLELMSLSGAGMDQPEFTLISDSCDNANARIRFFRIAFGMASDSAQVSHQECATILDGVYGGSRVMIDWRPRSDLSRREIQLAFLALQCAETALPRGGTITVDYAPGRWTVTAQGEKMNAAPDLWTELERLARATTPDQIDLQLSPAQVQFALLPLLARDIGRRPTCETAQDQLILTV